MSSFPPYSPKKARGKPSKTNGIPRAVHGIFETDSRLVSSRALDAIQPQRAALDSYGICEPTSVSASL